MLRIQCNCGKFLKVNESLAGKKIKCPGCSEVILVKASSDAVQAKSKPTAVVDEDDAPAPPPRKMAAASQDTTAQAPKKRKVRDDGDEEDEEPRPKKKKKTKKKENNNMLLIAGGGGALLLVAAITGGAFFLMGGSGDNKTPAPKGGGADGPKSSMVSGKLFVPVQKGDKREIISVADAKADMSVDPDSKAPPEFAAKIAEESSHEKTTLKAIVQTLAVSGQGEETKFMITVKEFESTPVGKAKSRVPTVAPGTTIIGSIENKEFHFTSPAGALPMGLDKMLPELLYLRYINEEEMATDYLLGTDVKQAVGATWTIKEDEIGKILLEVKLMDGIGGPVESAQVNGTGKLDGVTTLGGKNFVDMSFNIKGTRKDSKLLFEFVTDATVRVPSDGSTGPVKKTNKSKFNSTFDIPLPPVPGQVGGAPVKVKMTGTSSVNVDIKYLGNAPIDQPSTSDPSKGTASSGSLKAQLTNPTVTWIEPQQALNVSVSYSLIGNGKPKADANYILFVKVADSGGVKQSHQVQSQTGAALAATGMFVNPSVSMSVPAVNRPTVCELVLVEKSGGNAPDAEIARQDNVAINGINSPPTPGRVAIELTGASVDQLSNKKETRFTVDYKVTSNNPDPFKTYRLVVDFEGKSKLQAKPFEAKGSEMGPQDTIVKKLAFDVPVGTKFSMSLTEDNGPGTAAAAVSNVVKGEVAAATSDVMPVQFQIVGATAVKMPAQQIPGGGGIKKGGGGIGKAAPQFNLTFQWNLASGQCNPKATYAFVVVFKGGSLQGPQPLAPPLRGNDVPKTGGNFGMPVPFTGQTAYEIYVLENLPGQQPRRVSNMAVGRVQ